jgi:glyoxylase-like metal-dependent hydrolase (beta-lactamase superfamily II)
MSKAAAANFTDHLDHGISVVDTGFVRDRFDASYLIAHNGRGAFVDTGTNNAVPRLLGSLEERDLEPDQVDWVILTHVHLDHAGGAGLLMQHLPNAKLVVHSRGARHMVDPSALIKGVRAVYGDEVTARDYGELVPVAADRVVTATDGFTIDLGGRTLTFADTPGHAMHHNCIWDQQSSGWFTGDTFGLAYPDLATPVGSHVVPSSTPVQFDPVALHASVARLLAAKPLVMYPTHFGPVNDVSRLAEQLLWQADSMVSAAIALTDAPQRHERLRSAFEKIYIDELRRCGSTLDEATILSLLATDIELNAQGMAVWLDRQKKS